MRLLTVIILVCVSLIGAQTAQAATADLLLTPGFVPRNFPLNVVIQGPHGFRRVVHHTSLLHVPAGQIKMVVRSEVLAHAYASIPAGSHVFPNPHLFYPVRKATFVTSLAAGLLGIMRANYGTAISARTVVLHTKPIAVTGPLQNPTSIRLPASPGLHRGQILAQAPNSILPFGLFDRVINIGSSNGQLTVSLQPASISEAFPLLRLIDKLPIPSSPGALSLTFSQAQISQGLEASCPSLTPGWQFQPSGALSPSLLFQYVHGIGAPESGQVGAQITGQLGLTASFSGGAHCQLALAGTELPAAMTIAGVPIPVVEKTGFQAAVQSSGPISAQFNGELFSRGELKRMSGSSWNFGGGPMTITR